jgi:trimeric autotransporter adhesin
MAPVSKLDIPAVTRTTARRTRRTVASLVASSVALAGLLALQAPSADANSWPSPSITQPATVSADALPTVQINGVVWAQVIVGNTVYVGGNFTSARPAGSPLGTGEIPRSHFLAYDLTTGALAEAMQLGANAQVRSLAVSPDGTRLYVGGDFTTFGGQARSRLAAVDTATNTLVPGFAPNVGYHVYGVSATNSTVYVGGAFLAVGTQVRNRLAAFSASGQLLAWAPSAADRNVWDVQVSPDGSKVAVAGQFETFNGSTTFGRGLAVVDAVSGATVSFPATDVIRNGGPDGAITTLATDGQSLYGGGYTFGRTAGVLEGTFSADWATGALTWVADCHGDTYSVEPVGDAVYTASHAHYCGNIGGFGQPDSWEWYRGTAFSKAVAGTSATERLGYADFAGRPRPDLLNFFPTINAGTFTGQDQGAWSVTGNDRYVVYGGEFTTVNGATQQGLVRFQRRDVASNRQGPTLFNTTYPIKVRSLGAGSVTISWSANRDRDDATLRYTVQRRVLNSGANPQSRHTRLVTAPFWNRPVMTYTDTADIGVTYEYRVQVTDGYPTNFANSPWVPVTPAASGSISPYLSAVLASEPDSLWRLGESGGTTALDLVGFRDATIPANGVALNQAGATADGSTAATFNGATGTFVRTNTAELPPHTMSLEAWFRTSTNANGGLIAGFNNSNTANSGAGSTAAQDRHIYMDANGRLYFAVNPTTPVAVSTERNYRDNEWHHVVGTLGADGMKLYVDGVLVAQRTEAQWGRTGYYGFWRIGGGALNGFPNANTTTGRWFDGQIDDVALYKKVLTSNEVGGHYAAAGRTANLPEDPYGLDVHGDLPSLYWRLGELSGTTASDSGTQARNGTYSGSVALGASGAVVGTTNTAVTFNGTNARVSTTGVAAAAPSVYTQELWFKTTTTRGGKLIGFGDSSGTGNSLNSDRHVYMQDDGTLVFGASTSSATLLDQGNVANQYRITTPSAYNDGAWHHVVATQGADGMKLYVDGHLVGTNTAATTGRAYNGYWRVGGDPTWGSTSGYLNGAIDEVAIYPTVLDAATVLARYNLGAGVVPNQAPTAAFSTSVDAGNGLLVTANASTSTDPDGTIVDHAWDFGDGSPVVSGPSSDVSHTYATASTFTITLTVTDDDGDKHQTSGPVTTIGPNLLPVADVTAHIAGLDVATDGSGSTDADGAIVSWAWNWGDSSPDGAGVTAAHTYASAGTYTVTLTVTDNRGGTHQLARTVSVAALPAAPPVQPSVLALDTFGRTAATGLGTADLGGAWTLSSASTGYAVADGRGSIRMSTVAGGPSAWLGGVSTSNASVVTDIMLDKEPTGGGVYVTLLGRRINGVGDYRATLRHQANGTVQALIVRRVGSTDTTLAVVNAVAGLAPAPGRSVSARFEVSGTNPTTLRLKAWTAGSAEPAAWLLSTTDGTASHQVAGAVGLATYLSGSATNAPVTASFDNLSVSDPTAAVNAAPGARFAVTVDGLGVTFDGSLSVDDAPLTNWVWDFGDGSSATTGPTVAHQFAAAGTYLVTLTVTDSQGVDNSFAMNVSVDP